MLLEKKVNRGQPENRALRARPEGTEQQEEVAALERREEWVFKGYLALGAKLEPQELLVCLEPREDRVVLETGVDRDLLDYRE